MLLCVTSTLCAYDSYQLTREPKVDWDRCCPVEHFMNSPTKAFSAWSPKKYVLLWCAGRTGGAYTYIPPFKLARMMAEIQDKSSAEAQRMTWDALRKSLNGLINKVKEEERGCVALCLSSGALSSRPWFVLPLV